MSTRDELAENLTAYIDGELSELDAKRVEEALKSDAELSKLEQQLRATVTAVEKLETPQASQALRREVLNRLDTPPTAFEKLKALFTLPRLVPVAGLAAALAVTIGVMTRKTSERPPLDAETLEVAQNMEVIEDMDIIGLESADDLDVIASLHELEGHP
jgi:anti-sigma factor RsiW